MFEAKTNLSRYVASVVSQQEPYVVITRNGKLITRNGKPVAKIVPFEEDAGKRIGLAEGCLPYGEQFLIITCKKFPTKEQRALHAEAALSAYRDLFLK